MTQQAFTDYIFAALIKRFPAFQLAEMSAATSIQEIHCRSKQEKITLWLSTADKEITLGFAGDTSNDWHTHMNLSGAQTPEAELEAAIRYIEAIVENKQMIIHSTVYGYFPGDAEDLANSQKHRQEQEHIQTFYWKDL